MWFLLDLDMSFSVGMKRAERDGTQLSLGNLKLIELAKEGSIMLIKDFSE